MMTELLNTRKELDVKLNHRQKKMVSVYYLYALSHVHVLCHVTHSVIVNVLYIMVTLGLFHFTGPTNSYTHTLPIHSAITRLG